MGIENKTSNTKDNNGNEGNFEVEGEV